MPENLKPGLLPCPFCEGTNFDAFIELEPPNYGRFRCVKCSASVASTTLVRAIKNWNTRAPSELERLAREAARLLNRPGQLTHLENYAGDGLMVDAFRSLAAFFAEPSQKGK